MAAEELENQSGSAQIPNADPTQMPDQDDVIEDAEFADDGQTPETEAATEPESETVAESTVEPESELEDEPADSPEPSDEIDSALDLVDDEYEPLILETDAIPRKRGSGIKKALIVIAAAVVLIVAGCCAALAADDSTRMQKIPETTMLDEQIDITGMTQDELSNLLETRANNGVASIVSLDVNGTRFDVNLRDVGTLKVEETVAQAFAPYNTDMLTRWSTRIAEFVTGDTGRYDVYTVYEIDHDALSLRIGEIANEVYVEAEDAGYIYDGDANALAATAPVNGVELDVDSTVAAIEGAIVSPTDLSLSRFNAVGATTVTVPEELEPGQAIYVDTRSCRVHLYENGEEVESYPCTPGQSGYPTPKGEFYLEYKDGAPVWINPHSDWSASMPDRIEPGASNPLGLRALAVSCGGGIYIHGTTNTGGLGSPGSHGCVRLSNSDIIELYNRVSEGIPIIIR